MTSDPALAPRTLRSDEDARWDAFVAASPQGSVFSRSAYLDALDVRRQVIVIERAGQIEAGMVLARNRAGLLTNPLLVKHLGVLLRPVVGATARRQSVGQRAIGALATYTRSMSSFDYNFGPYFDNWLPYHWSGYRQQTRYTYRIGRQSEGVWMRQGDAEMRNDLRRAERAGVEVIADPPVVAIVAAVAASYARQGARAPMRSGAVERFVARGRASHVVQTFGARSAAGDVVAAAVLAVDGRCAFLVLNGVCEGAPAGTNTLLIGRAIDWALARGMSFDFEGSMIRPIERYYRGFGGELLPYFRIWRPGPLNLAKCVAQDLAKRLLGYRR